MARFGSISSDIYYNFLQKLFRDLWVYGILEWEVHW